MGERINGWRAAARTVVRDELEEVLGRGRWVRRSWVTGGGLWRLGCRRA